MSTSTSNVVRGDPNRELIKEWSKPKYVLKVLTSKVEHKELHQGKKGSSGANDGTKTLKTFVGIDENTGSTFKIVYTMDPNHPKEKAHHATIYVKHLGVFIFVTRTATNGLIELHRSGYRLDITFNPIGK